MTGENVPTSTTPAAIGSTTYYAVLHDGFAREWPSGLRRRTVVDASGATLDEAWTARGRWETTFFFRAATFGDFSAEDVALVEIDEAEAEAVRSMIGVRPRGGPFTEAGQRWLREHPDDRAAGLLDRTRNADQKTSGDGVEA